MPKLTNTNEVFQLSIFFISVIYLLGFGGVGVGVIVDEEEDYVEGKTLLKNLCGYRFLSGCPSGISFPQLSISFQSGTSDIAAVSTKSPVYPRCPFVPSAFAFLFLEMSLKRIRQACHRLHPENLVTYHERYKRNQSLNFS